MKLPEIDLDDIPGLPTRTGMYGSIGDGTGGGYSDDRVVALMVFLYNTSNGSENT